MCDAGFLAFLAFLMAEVVAGLDLPAFLVTISMAGLPGSVMVVTSRLRQGLRGLQCLHA